MENPFYEQLVDIRKVDWSSIAHHYGIPVTTSMCKEPIKNLIVESLESQIMPEAALQALTPVGFPHESDIGEQTTHSPVVGATALEKLFELEKLKIQYQ